MKKELKENENWLNIRNNLNNNYEMSVYWKEAVDLFEKRINQKYLKPIEILISTNNRKGEGFVIVTTQCALIESFAAFKKGLIYNYNKPSQNGIPYEYKDCGELFINFLNSEEIFKNIFFIEDNFGNKQPNVPFNANHFYSKVRCGLIHEARTKGNWYINATENDSKTDGIFIKQKKKGNIIYRTLLHFALVNYFNKYKLELLDPKLEFNELRRFFARKLDHLYDIKDDFEWWNHN